ncbi:hypothetical protein Tco_0169392 [Tanacetum coccineum]
MDSGVMLFGLVLLGVVFGPRLVAVLATRSTCRPSLASCLSSLGESLPSMPDAYAVAVSDVPGDGSRMHTHDHGGSEAPDGSPDSI